MTRLADWPSPPPRPARRRALARQRAEVALDARRAAGEAVTETMLDQATEQQLAAIEHQVAGIVADVVAVARELGGEMLVDVVKATIEMGDQGALQVAVQHVDAERAARG